MTEDCDKSEDRLSALLDGELTDAEERACRQHLEACEECRALLDRLTAARELLRTVPPPTPPHGLLAAIKAEARRDERSRRSILERLRPAYAVGFAAAAAVLVIALLPHLTPDMTTHDVPEYAPAEAVEALPAPDPTPEPPAVAEVAEAEAESEPEVSADGTEPQAEPTQIALVRPEVATSSVARPSTPARAAVAGDDAAAEADEPAPEPVATAPEVPQVAYAETVDAAVTTGSASLGPGEGEAAMVAMAPRIAPGEAAIEAEEPAEPSSLETEVATGVVARMVIDRYIANNVVQSRPTLLALITDTPATEAGPVLADEAASDRFNLRFTESMRQVLTGTGAQIQ